MEDLFKQTQPLSEKLFPAINVNDLPVKTDEKNVYEEVLMESFTHSSKVQAQIVEFFDGKETLKENCPHVLIGTPGRVLALLRNKDLKLCKLTKFVLDGCVKCLDKLDGSESNNAVESNNGFADLAATSRADILDAALVRPGRLDSHIQVEGRTAILKVHAKGKSWRKASISGPPLGRRPASPALTSLTS
jgi:SpoVK/Ycf46/Vps4 family AAA+-type ATPase